MNKNEDKLMRRHYASLQFLAFGIGFCISATGFGFINLIFAFIGVPWYIILTFKLIFTAAALYISHRYFKKQMDKL